MKDNRKHLRIAIPADKVEAFKAAKKKAEEAAMISLTDTQFASRIIQKALEYQNER